MNLIPFDYEGNQLRTVTKDNDTWFVAKDVCDILGLEQVTRAMDRLGDDERGLVKVTHPQSLNKYIDVNAVNEPGLYQLILASTKPEAKAFKRWITHEVIPQIRKTGSYSQPMSQVQILQQSINLLVQHEERVKRLEETQNVQKDHIADQAFAIADLEQKVTNEITLTSKEQAQIQGAVKERVARLGNNKEHYSKLYSSLKKRFMVPSYKDIKKSDLRRAFDFIGLWTPNTQPMNWQVYTNYR